LLRPHRTLTAVFLALALLAAGCGGSDKSDGAAPNPGAAEAGASSTTAPGPATETAPPVADDGGPATGATPGGGTPGSAPTGTPSAPSGGSAAPAGTPAANPSGRTAAGTADRPAGGGGTAGGSGGGAAPRPGDSRTPATPTPAPGPGPGPAGSQPGSTPVLRLGGVFPLSGPLGSVGTAMMQGVQAILTETNEAGGIGGSRLELVVEDDQFDPVRGKALIQKLIHETKVFAFAGIFSPFTIQAGLPDIRLAGVPVVSPSGSDDREFDEPLLYPVTNPCGRQMAGNVQHLVQEKKARKLAVVYLNVEAVSNCTKQFTAVAKKLGAQVVFESATAPAAPDCASRILSARASGADALVVIVDNLGVVKCVQAQKQQGWNVPVSISYNIVDDPTLLDGLGKGAEGLLSSSPFSGGSSPAFADQCGAVQRFYPKAKVQFFLLVGCLGTKLLVEGLRVTGATGDRGALLRALDSGRVFSFGGLVPDLSYGPNRHLPYDLTATVEVKDGKWARTGPLYTPEKP
jgi:branched-chain amino acid transport system substrate-binding protein